MMTNAQSMLCKTKRRCKKRKKKEKYVAEIVFTGMKMIYVFMKDYIPCVAPGFEMYVQCRFRCECVFVCMCADISFLLRTV